MSTYPSMILSGVYSSPKMFTVSLNNLPRQVLKRQAVKWTLDKTVVVENEFKADNDRYLRNSLKMKYFLEFCFLFAPKVLC